jgi:thioredoxin reductase
MTQIDVAVIGGGAAGLSAALVLSRARRKVVVVDAGPPRNAPAAHLHGYLSHDGLPPAELLASGPAEVISYGGDFGGTPGSVRYAQIALNADLVEQDVRDAVRTFAYSHVSRADANAS